MTKIWQTENCQPELSQQKNLYFAWWCLISILTIVICTHFASQNVNNDMMAILKECIVNLIFLSAIQATFHKAWNVKMYQALSKIEKKNLGDEIDVPLLQEWKNWERNGCREE